MAEGEEEHGCHAPPKWLDDRRDGSACSIHLERKDDGNLIGAHLACIRSCMKDLLSKIWSADVIEISRKGHQRTNSPAGEQVQEFDENFLNSHVNIVDS